MPLAAVTGRDEIMDAPSPGGLGGTYGGNPLAIAAALAVLDVLDEEQLCQRAGKLGSDLIAHLRDLQTDVPELGDVRGLGFMVATEFVTAEGAPNPEMAQRVKAGAMARGLILLTCGVSGNVIRFLAPLTIPDPVFAEALDILSDVIPAAREVAK